LSGPDLAGLAALKKAVDAEVIASGGVTTVGDIKALAALGISGVICGKSIYKGTLTLKDALIYQTVSQSR
jgi:phosphoribosylformimino-5-aminoimidazole carboxamide ribotide isomerase